MNRKKNCLEHQKRIQKALTFIQENLDKPLTLKEVAEAACFSEYHFHRVFSAVMNEPLGEYITRKKLERAASRLAYSPENRVSDIAFEYGYSSVSSFSKAFNQWFGFRPTEISKIKDHLNSPKGKLKTKYNKEVDPDLLFVSAINGDQEKRFKEIDRQVRIQNIDAFQLYYLTSSKGYELSGVHEVWQKLSEILEDAEINIETCKRFAISHDHPGLTPLSHCRYDACVLAPDGCEVDLPLPTVTVPAGRFAIYRVEGPEESILGQYLEFCTVWLPQSGYELDNFPVLEHYPENNCDGYVVAELWEKIKRLTLL